MIAVYNILWCHSLALGLDGDGHTVFVAAAYHHHLFTVKAQKPCVNIGGHIHPGQLAPTDLINPRSALTDTVPVMKETFHWYLPLDKWEDYLRRWILDGHKEWRSNVYGQCKSMPRPAIESLIMV